MYIVSHLRFTNNQRSLIQLRVTPERYRASVPDHFGSDFPTTNKRLTRTFVLIAHKPLTTIGFIGMLKYVEERYRIFKLQLLLRYCNIK